jgi:polyferredoxin
MSARIDLLDKAPGLKPVLKSRRLQAGFTLLMLAGFVLAILAGWFGTPAGNRNFGIVFVWIVWWALLIVVLVPLAGRAWCMVCPIPAPGEWLQRRGIVRRTPGRLRTLRRRWPRRLKNMWPQNIGFLAIATFSAVILTRPHISAWVLFGFTVAAVVLSVLYDNRVFCRYLCPVGGFIGLYAMMAPLEVRARDCSTCRFHREKSCVVGSETGYGCPWMVYVGNLKRNTYCGLCMECMRACPKDNVTVNLRPFGADLLVFKEHRLDEAYKAFIMLACALLYSAVLLGPWGWLKDWANMDNLLHWGIYALAFWGINLALLPGLFLAATWAAHQLGGQQVALKQLFVDYAYALVPLGLAAWIAFSLGFVFANGSYALAVVSDPFGWGWNLFGTAAFPWSPALPGVVSFLQVGVLTAGLLSAANVIYRTTQHHSLTPQRALRASLPPVLFLAAVTVAFLWLYLG